MLSFGEAVRRFYGNYTNPEGRAQRSAYWWVVLYRSILISVFFIVIFMADGGPEFFEGFVEVATVEDLTAKWAGLGFSGRAAGYCLLAFSLVNVLPNIMLSIRRFHDLGQTGWLVLAFFAGGALLPPVAALANIANFIWFAFKGTEGPNQYGPDPLGSNLDTFS